MPDYNRSLIPPEGDVSLETPNGLKYWLVKHPPFEGRVQSVMTEDTAIAMHEYVAAGPGGPFGSFLFCYKDTRIGFSTLPLGRSLGPERPETLSVEDRISCVRVRAAGTRVFDSSYNYARHPKTGAILRDFSGKPIRKKLRDQNTNDMWVTGVNWETSETGYREKFPPRIVQNEMVEL